ncbi:HTH domain-containing protein [Natrialba sp. INN-245]|uniref:HTH domain-containing protein n=1 Tax=Natrialba sp. INN-245 TaxID=2690967 RepID=UPI00190FA61D|nr:HTH domain-containing protein [Natrialba sp. INN-245]
MPAGETATAETAFDPPAECHVVCYVRSHLPGSIAGTVETVTDRLRRLSEEGRLAGCRIEHWPPERHALAGAGERTSRDDLLREFERWAERHGCSLEPGFRRESRPTSRFVVDSEPAADERIRVPVVALVLYDGPPSEAADVRGVIPRTEPRDAGDERTITVEEWLAAVETGGREPTVETTTGPRLSSLEGGR